jgi:hypothetical protein
MKTKVMFFVMVFSVVILGIGHADEAEILRELETLKQRIEELEVKLSQQEQKMEEAEYEGAQAGVWRVKNLIMERLGTLSVHGGVVGYHQGMTATDRGVLHETACRGGSQCGRGHCASWGRLCQSQHPRR